MNLKYNRMKKFHVIGGLFLAMALTMSCTGNKTEKGIGSDSDSVANVVDSMPADLEGEEVERLAGLLTTMAPVPLYLRTDPEEGEVIQVVYWTPLNKPQPEDDANYQESWLVQDLMRKNADHYTEVLNDDGQLCGVTFVEDITDEDADNAMLRSPQHPMQGLKFKFNDPKQKAATMKEYALNMLWLLPDGYQNSRKMLKVKHLTENNRKPMPTNIVKQMETKYGMTTEKAYITSEIDGGYKTGFIQFKPKGKKCLAVEVLTRDDTVWSYSDEAQYFEEENAFSWHVDDEGEYFPNYYDVAFVGPGGIEILYTHIAPESTDFGWMTVKGDKLVRHEVGGYYNYPE